VKNVVTPTKPLPSPQGAAAARTYSLLMATALEVIREGHVPSIAELAVRAKVSRATAYRYFPSRTALITTVVHRSLTGIRSWKSRHASGLARVEEMFAKTFPSFNEFEPQLRAALQLSLEQWALERAGALEEAPYRRGHRVRVIQHALEPFEGQIKPKILDRLTKALTIIYGIGPSVELKDILGASNREVNETALWMARALVQAAINESSGAKHSNPTQTSKRVRSAGSD
jgi:AcrR family transcriptional regulator